MTEKHLSNKLLEGQRLECHREGEVRGHPARVMVIKLSALESGVNCGQKSMALKKGSEGMLRSAHSLSHEEVFRHFACAECVQPSVAIGLNLY